MLKWKKLKHRHKIAASILLFTLLPLMLLSSILMLNLWDINVEEIIENNKLKLDYRVEDVNDLLSSHVNKILFINNNFYIYNFLVEYDEQDLVQIVDFNNYLQSLTTVLTVENPSTEIAIYVLQETIFDGKFLRNFRLIDIIEEHEEKSLKDKILGYEAGAFIWEFRTIGDDFVRGAINDYLCIYRKIVYLDNPIAITEIKIPFRRITEVFSYDIPEGSFIVFELFGETKRIVNSSDKSDISYSENLEWVDSDKWNRSGYYAINLDLKAGIGKVSMFLPRDLVFQEFSFYLFLALLVFIVIAILLFFVVEVVAVHLTNKLEGLFSEMSSNVESLIKSENPRVYNSDDEFVTIGTMFNDLVGRVKDYCQKIAKYETEMTLLETQLLQERINPHFLYNTLSTMKWLYKDKSIHNVLDSMVKYYRIALNKGSSIISISLELEMIEQYLKLQIFAYGNEFKYKIDVEEGVGNCMILKNLLQPIVENAVIHGLSGLETGGVINIRVKKTEESVSFEISDNGAGMQPATIEKILYETKDGECSGYGLSNIIKRLHVFYGEKFGIEFDSTPSKGTTVTIKIPAELNSDFQGNIR